MPSNTFAIILTLVAAAAPPPPPAREESPPATPKTPPPAKTLDDLLGTGRAGDPERPPAGEGAESAAPDLPPTAQESALRRALTEEEAADAFRQAIVQMARSAALLAEKRDGGLETQRVQEDVLAKLDLLLRQPPRRGQSQSSPQQQRNPQQQQQVPDQPQEERPGDASQQAANPASDSDPRAGPPRREDASLEAALESAGAEWGSLPERVRDMIRQGLRDRPSSLYLRLTEDYYRRLAEEAR